MQVTDEYLELINKYGPVDCLDTRTFFVGPKLASVTEVTYLSEILFTSIILLILPFVCLFFFFYVIRFMFSTVVSNYRFLYLNSCLLELFP